MNKEKIIAALVITAVLGLSLYSWLKTEDGRNVSKTFDWHTDREAAKTNTQPYNLQLFDGVLKRSLNNGYSVSVIPQRWIGDNDVRFDDANSCYISTTIADASADTALLLIKDNQSWKMATENPYGDNDDDNVTAQTVNPKMSPLLSLIEFASKGGTAIYVTSISDKDYEFGKNGRFYDRSMPYDQPLTEKWNDIYVSSYDWFDSKWYSERENKYVDAKAGDSNDPDATTIKLNKKFAPKTLIAYKNAIEENNALAGKNGDVQIPRITPCLVDSTGDVYAYDIYYPDTGGRLIVTTLSTYLCNFGVMLPEGPEVIAAVMSMIDSKPVKRIDYDFWFRPYMQEFTLFDVMKKNPSLMFAWILTLALCAALLARGLMRRQPATATDALLDDNTDIIAMRDNKFRRSPRLHFLYQCSWLYAKSQRYDELFQINFSIVARNVSRYTATEVANARPDEMREAARKLAPTLSVSAEYLCNELLWLQSTRNELSIGVVRFISAEQYKRSCTLANLFKK